jgi:phytanoyl-CoA dioxygenase PhyH
MAREIRGFFANKTCSDPYYPERGRFNPPNDVPKGVYVAYFDAELVVQTPHIFEIVNNPVVLGAVARVLGATPTISYMAVWWSLPAGDGTAQQAENFHRDFDDWRFVKYIVYLTDVDEDSGPHIFIPGSHKQNKLLPIRRYTAEEIAGAFGQGNEKLFVGPAGTSFLENTYGFHRGLPAKSKPRLALAATYSLRVIPYGPRAPIAAIGQNGIPADIDSYINRIYTRAMRRVIA